LQEEIKTRARRRRRRDEDETRSSRSTTTKRNGTTTIRSERKEDKRTKRREKKEKQGEERNTSAEWRLNHDTGLLHILLTSGVNIEQRHRTATQTDTGTQSQT
jgi:hypothetical protein